MRTLGCDLTCESLVIGHDAKVERIQPSCWPECAGWTGGAQGWFSGSGSVGTCTARAGASSGACERDVGDSM